MNKVLNIIKNVITWLLIILSVGMMVFTIISVNTFDRNDRDLFGYKAFIVNSDSMSSVDGDKSLGYFSAGDLIIVKEVDPTVLKPGDIVSYRSTNADNYGQTVTHMIREAVTDDYGAPGFITYGTSTGANDDNVVTYPYILGQYNGRIPLVGSFFQFLKTPPGYIVCILLPFILLIGMYGINSVRLFKKYKAEQLEAIEAERAKEREALDAERAAMAEERRKQEEMMRKLLEMQAAIQKNQNGSSDNNATKKNESPRDGSNN